MNKGVHTLIVLRKISSLILDAAQATCNFALMKQLFSGFG
jgi:hypothetical protein